MSPQTAPPSRVPGESPYRIEPGGGFRIADHDTAATDAFGSKEEVGERLLEVLEQISELSDRLAKQAERSLLVVLQGFDGAGKDAVISRVLTAVDPSSLHVFSFNKPVGDEADHDFLWRFHQQTPKWGRIHVFDRSYYEEVIGARVHGVITEDACRARYDSINDFERILARDGMLILKFFLHIDKSVQAGRIEERLEKRSEHADFGAADVKDRDLWSEHGRAYEDTINATTTEYAPWHVIPADRRWFSCMAVAEALVSTLAELDPQYPLLDADEIREAGMDPADFETA